MMATLNTDSISPHVFNGLVVLFSPVVNDLSQYIDSTLDWCAQPVHAVFRDFLQKKKTACLGFLVFMLYL